MREMAADWAGTGPGEYGKWDLREWWNKIRSTILLEQGTQFHVDTLVRQLDACLNKTKTSPPRLVSHLTHAITRIQSFEPSRSNRL